MPASDMVRKWMEEHDIPFEDDMMDDDDAAKATAPITRRNAVESFSDIVGKEEPDSQPQDTGGDVKPDGHKPADVADGHVEAAGTEVIAGKQAGEPNNPGDTGAKPVDERKPQPATAAEEMLKPADADAEKSATSTDGEPGTSQPVNEAGKESGSFVDVVASQFNVKCYVVLCEEMHTRWANRDFEIQDEARLSMICQTR